MPRRKGELSSARLDREWPFQVAVPGNQCAGDRIRIMSAFCIDLSLAPRTHTVRRDDIDYIVFCFADGAHAEKFRQRFNGETFDPACRGKGRDWFSWREPKRKTYGRN